MSVKVKVVAVSGAQAPKYATKGSSGLDLVANLKRPTENDPEVLEEYQIVINPGDRKLIPTGLKMAIPFGYEGQIRPRSGVAKKNKVTVLNSPGTIDADYRGEVGVLLVNHGNSDFTVTDGDRIAQIVFQKVEQVEWENVETLEETERGEGGFGSTGMNTADTANDQAGNQS